MTGPVNPFALRFKASVASVQLRAIYVLQVRPALSTARMDAVEAGAALRMT